VAAVAVLGVAVVAHLAGVPIDDAVAALLERQAVPRAAVAALGVAVVADLARIEDAVAALLDLAARAAAVARQDVAVVALLARIDEAVATRVIEAHRLHRAALLVLGAVDPRRA